MQKSKDFFQRSRCVSSASSLFAHMALRGGRCQGWRYLARIITIKEITMQKEQLLLPLLTNHRKQAGTTIDGERGRGKQGRGGAAAHVLLFHNFASEVSKNPFNLIRSANKAFGGHSPESCTNTSICPDYLSLSPWSGPACP